MKAHTDALHKRWHDPVYRERQIAANRRAAADRAAHFADPLARKQHSQAVKVGQRISKRGAR